LVANTNAFNVVTCLSSAIHFKNPPQSPFFKGGNFFIPLFGKEGSGEIYGTRINAFSIKFYYLEIIWHLGFVIWKFIQYGL
jgi:hypothetical protein